MCFALLFFLPRFHLSLSPSLGSIKKTRQSKTRASQNARRCPTTASSFLSLSLVAFSPCHLPILPLSCTGDGDEVQNLVVGRTGFKPCAAALSHTPSPLTLSCCGGPRLREQRRQPEALMKWPRLTGLVSDSLSRLRFPLYAPLCVCLLHALDPPLPVSLATCTSTAPPIPPHAPFPPFWPTSPSARSASCVFLSASRACLGCRCCCACAPHAVHGWA